jgi:hypothetical protein
VSVRYRLGGDAAWDGPDEKRHAGYWQGSWASCTGCITRAGNQAGAGPHRSTAVHANGATTHPASAETPGRSRRPMLAARHRRIAVSYVTTTLTSSPSTGPLPGWTRNAPVSYAHLR